MIFYWLAHTILAIQSTSEACRHAVDVVRVQRLQFERLGGAALQFLDHHLAVIGVFTTTRSPLRIGAPGDTTMTSPSR